MVNVKNRTRRLTIREAEDYSGYAAEFLRDAVKRGDLYAERPSGGIRGRLYFTEDGIDEWLDAIAVTSEEA